MLFAFRSRCEVYIFTPETYADMVRLTFFMVNNSWWEIKMKKPRLIYRYRSWGNIHAYDGNVHLNKSANIVFNEANMT